MTVEFLQEGALLLETFDGTLWKPLDLVRRGPDSLLMVR